MKVISEGYKTLSDVLQARAITRHNTLEIYKTKAKLMLDWDLSLGRLAVVPLFLHFKNHSTISVLLHIISLPKIKNTQTGMSMTLVLEMVWPFLSHLLLMSILLWEFSKLQLFLFQNYNYFYNYYLGTSFTKSLAQECLNDMLCR